MDKIKVLIVDDSALVRQALTEILGRDPALEVVGVAGDPYMARDKILRLGPDVLTLDVEMPRMDGLTFLEKLMRAHPMPVVMVSSLTEKGCETTLRALELGAVDFVAKPKLDVQTGTLEMADLIVAKVKAAALGRGHEFGSIDQEHAQSYRHRRVDWGHRSPARSARTFAAGFPGYRDGATHAGEVHGLVRGAAELALAHPRQ